MAREQDNHPATPAAVVGVRLTGLLISSVAVWQLMGNVLDTWRDFNPSYLGYYFTSQLLRPLLGLAIGGVLLCAGRRIGRWIGRP